MGIRFTREKDAGESGRRKFIISLSPAGMAGLGAICLLSFIWVFVFGLLVGRGFQPEEAIPELKRFMPTADSRTGSNASTASPAPSPEANATAGIIKPEDLKFYDHLKTEAAPSPKRAPVPQPKPTTVTQTQQPVQIVEQIPSSAAQPSVSALQPQKQPRQANAVPPTAPVQDSVSSLADQITAGAKENKGGADDATVYNYVYQVAAFRERGAAESLKSRIEASGLKARIESIASNDATWYRIQVLFQGTPEDTRRMKDALLPLGISKPLLKDKQLAR
ncbi:SPOR domain-containing protein [Desulfovibrio psychrotolerans]|uniref:Sporulation protein n=1 Tax=Desulfovibrio psychrotolerans TaxID=415242 RepID=A0A7J0BUQ4_9BACT|nr:SPOR domain-containing protein [Desulfovibrio psychrotolerans]GFM37436.1 sporulation protein [Desulfovibrio psychrotolerans]